MKFRLFFIEYKIIGKLGSVVFLGRRESTILGRQY